MSLHDVQITGFSQLIHKFFGSALLVGALFRIIALTVAPALDFVVPTFLICAGLYLTSATEESIAFLISIYVDPVSFAAALAGVALLIQAWVTFLVRIREGGEPEPNPEVAYGALDEVDEQQSEQLVMEERAMKGLEPVPRFSLGSVTRGGSENSSSATAF